MIANNKFLYSLIEYRQNPARAEHGKVVLGVVVEFEVDGTWVVGLYGRDSIGPEETSSLDPIARDLYSNPGELMDQELRKIIYSHDHQQTGDVLKMLSSENPWSFFVTAPQMLEIPPETELNSKQEAPGWNLVNYYTRDAPHAWFGLPPEMAAIAAAVAKDSEMAA